jgi:CheY-like chemotaxis protein
MPVSGDAELPALPPAGPWQRGRGETVAVVDDEPALVELAEELLAGLGYEPVGFASAEAALRAFAADPGRFDMVLSDVAMPGMTGCQLATLLHRTRPELPVALTSGNVDTETQHRAREAGVAVLLRKPLALQEVADVLARLLHDR